MTAGPYAQAAHLYWAAGWRGILPLPANDKKYPPKGFTGAAGAWPSYADIHAWSEGPEGAGNLALRLPPHVIGIDVDNYGDKLGAQTLALFEAQHGKLPPTWRSTSRDDGISGIYFYRVPEGLNWPGELGPGVEIIQYRHRYAVAWPSVHPEGGTYRFFNHEQLVSTVIPDTDADFPLLPEAAVMALTGGELAVDTPRANIKHDQAVGWIAGQDHATDTMCARMTKAVEQHAKDLSGSAHNSTRDAALRVARLASEGHYGAVHALATVRTRFLNDATNANRDLLGTRRRTLDEATYEWSELVASAVGVVLGKPSDMPTCDCHGQITGLLIPTTAPVSDGATALAAMPIPETVVEPAPTPQPAERFKDGATFILDAPDSPPNVWGEDDDCLWAEGEALMIVGPPGVGKTTLTGQVVRGLLGLQKSVLGLPVRPCDKRVLYLAMDRPAQIARGLRRAFHERERDTLADKLRFWEGPPPGDVAKHPAVLLSLAQLAEADVIVIDSVKDAAVGLSEDEVAAAYNRARQTCLANGVQVLELHHMVKRGAGGNKPKELADVYGSAWLTAGAGSVLLLWGAAGDPIVEMIHLKQPAGEVGPWKLEHDHDRGRTTVFQGTDVLDLVIAAGYPGTSAAEVAKAMFETEKPTTAEKVKARRKLEKLVALGVAETWEAPRQGVSGGKAQHWFRVAGSQRHPNDTPSFESPNDANDTPMTPSADSRSNPNDKPNITNDTDPNAGPMTFTPPPERGGDGGPPAAAPKGDLNCGSCGRSFTARIIEQHKGLCHICSRAGR